MALMFKSFFAIFAREIRLNLGSGGGSLLPTAFFAGAILILPFSLGPDVEMLRKIGPGFLWLATSLACLVSLERLFQGDIDDGSLDYLIMGQLPLSLTMLAKILGQWFAVALPLGLSIPIGGLMINVEAHYILPLTFQLFIGSLAMFLIGAIGSALGAGVKRGGLLVALLALPLYTPIIIFGAGSAGQIIAGNGVFSQGFMLIIAISLGGLVLSPIATAGAMRLHTD
jgi:heme exporter protein B